MNETRTQRRQHDRLKVAELRLDHGMTYQAIADHLGTNRERARLLFAEYQVRHRLGVYVDHGTPESFYRFERFK